MSRKGDGTVMSAVEKLSVTVPPEMTALIRLRIEEGAYASASEIVREGLRLWREREEERQAAVAAIRGSLEESARSGAPIPMDEAFDRVEERLRERFKDAG